MAVTLTEAAARHVTRYIAKRGHGVGVRLGVRTTGCSGLAYKLEYADEVAPEDLVFEGHGIKILIDPNWVRTHFAPLEGTRLELPQLAKDLGVDPGATVRLATADTETAIKDDKAVSEAKVVAIATHGFLATQVPGFKEPGLVFTPPQSPSFKDDGVLTASEAADLRFKADWIILSACDTATPDGTSGAQGMSSLAKAFLYAGAGSLLASHWPVSDEVTAALTSEVLKLRASGLTRAEALKQAMHTIRTGKRADGTPIPGYTTKWANPALWAPFSVISNINQ